MRNKILVILFLSIIAVSIVFAYEDEAEVAVCSEQLDICIEGYNNLLEDFRNDINCRGTAFDSVKKNNLILSIERDDYQKEAENLKNFRIGFYLILIIFIIFLIVYFREILKNKTNSKNRRKK